MVCWHYFLACHGAASVHTVTWILCVTNSLNQLHRIDLRFLNLKVILQIFNAKQKHYFHLRMHMTDKSIQIEVLTIT